MYRQPQCRLAALRSSGCRSLLSPDPGSRRLGELVADASTAKASSGGLYFLPYLLGERSPYWNADATGAFVGMRRHHGRAEMTRAVLEGVAFNLFTCIQAFREAGATVDRVDAIGGGAASDTWLQIMADVWGIPVRRRTIVEEGNSLGAAVTAAVGLGLVSEFGAARGLSQITAEFLPTGLHGNYLRRHLDFTAAYASLEGWFGAAERTLTHEGDDSMQIGCHGLVWTGTYDADGDPAGRP